MTDLRWCGEQYPRWHVDEDGNVYRDELKFQPYLADGYLMVWEPGRYRSVAVHELVCTAFHGPRPVGKQCAHFNDVKLDNRPQNLRWATSSENHLDAIRNGTAIDNRGERNGQSKITEDDVRSIRHAYAQGGITQRKLAQDYNISLTNVHMIVKDKSWQHVSTSPATDSPLS